jgi:hypothetical protein
VAGIKVYSRGAILDHRDAFGEFRRRGIEINLLENRGGLRFLRPDTHMIFPVTPHQEMPVSAQGISQELKRPEMGYNLSH